MYKGMKILCSICARGGSKGVKNKNIRSFAGKPLIAHTVQQALSTQIFDHIAVSSDSDEILREAEKAGADILIKRNDEMATDKAPKFPVIKHCAAEAEKRTGSKFDIFVDLDATSPLRIPEDIVGSVDLLMDSGANNVITGNHARKSPYFNMVEEDKECKVFKSKLLDLAITRRQDSPVVYEMNASIYVWGKDNFFDAEKIVNENTRLFEMPFERSIDIDSEVEFEIAEFLYKKRV